MARTAGLTLELNNFRSFTDEMRNLDRILDGLDNRIDRAGRAFDRIEREAGEAGRSLTGLGQDSQKASRQISNDFQAIGREAGRLEGVGERLEGLGARVTLFISGPAAALKALAANAAIEFESSFAGVIKTLDTTGLSAEETTLAFEEIRQGIRDLATDTDSAVAGIADAQNELSRIGELGGQLGIRREGLLQFTETVGQLTLATELTADAASTAIAQFANITGGQEFDRLGATIVALGNSMATTEGEILEFGSRLAGAGTQAGFTQADILGLGGAMASLGINAEAGGTAFTRVFNTLEVATATGNENLRTFAEVAGVSVDEFARLFEEDASAALTGFIDGLSELDRVSQLNVFEQLGFSDVRVQDTLSRLSSNPELLAQGFELANQAFAENTALQDEANQRFNTTAAQMNLLQNNIRDVAISLGDALLPRINSLIDFFVPLIQNLAEINPELLAFGASLLGIAAAAGPVILYAAQFAQFFSFLSGVSLSPLLIPLAAISLIIVDIATHTEEVGAAFTEFSTATNEFFGLVGGVANGAITAVSTLVGTVEEVGPSFSPVAFVLQGITDGIQAINAQLQVASDLLTLFNFATNDPMAAADAERNQLLRERGAILEDIRLLESGIAVSTGESLNHTVAQGDTLYDLARQYGVTVDELMRLNGLEGSTIFVGQELQVGESLSTGTGEALAGLQADLVNLDAELAAIPDSLQGIFDAFSGTPLFEQLFGTDNGATERALALFADIRVEADSIKTFIGEIGSAIQAVFTGDIEGSLGRIQSAFDGIGESVLSIFDLFFGLNPQPLDDIAQGVLRAEDEFGGVAAANPVRNFIESFQSEIGKLAGGDFSSISNFIENNIVNAIEDGIEQVQDWLAGPTSAIVGIGQRLVDSVIDDFLGIRRLLEASPLVQVLQSSFDAIFGQFFGDPFADLDVGRGEIKAELEFSDDIVPTSLFDRLNGFKDGIVDFFGGIAEVVAPHLQTLNTIFAPALRTFADGLAGFVNGVLTVSWPNLQATYDVSIAPVLNSLLAIGQDFITGGLVAFSSIIAGIGAALPSLGTALGSFGTAIGAITVGDIDGFFGAMSNGLRSLWDAVGLFSSGSLGNFDSIMGDLANQELEMSGAARGEIRAELEFGDDAGTQAGVSSQFQTIVDSVTGFFTDIQTQVQPFIDAWDATIGQGLRDIGDGLKGFVDGLMEADWSGFGVIAYSLGLFVGVLSGLAVAVLGAVLSGIGTALPEIGEAIGSLGNSLSSLLRGDLAGAGKGLVDFIWNIGEAFGGFVLGAANNVLGVLEELTGLDFASAEEGLGTLTSQIGQLYTAFVESFDIQQIVLDAKAVMLDFLLGFQVTYAAVLELLGQGGDGEALANATETATTISNIRLATGADALLEQQIAGGELDLSVPITVQVANRDAVTASLIEIISDPQLAFLLGDEAKETLDAALALATASGDFSSVGQLIAAGINTGILTDVNVPLSELIAGGASADDLAQLALDLGDAGINVAEIFSQSIADSIAAGDLDTAQLLTDAVAGSGGEEAIAQVAQDLANTFGTEISDSFLNLAVESGLDIETMTAIGADILAGLTTGISENRPALQSETEGVVSDIQGVITSLFQTNSPSVWMMDIGRDLMEGLGIGLEENMGLVAPIFERLLAYEQQLSDGMVAVRLQWSLQTKYMVEAIGVVRNQVESLIPAVQALQYAISAIGAISIVVSGSSGDAPVEGGLASGGRGEAGALYRVAEPSIGGLELIRTDAGGSYIVSSTGFEAFPAINSDFMFGGGRMAAGGNMGGNVTHISYGQVNINVPEGTATVTPDVIYQGMNEWSRQNTPERVNRNRI